MVVRVRAVTRFIVLLHVVVKIRKAADFG